MQFFRRKKAVNHLWVADGFLLPEHWYDWMEQARFRPAAHACVWDWLNALLEVKHFSAALCAHQDLADVRFTSVMRADPVHLSADWQGLAVADNRPAQLSHEEAQALCKEIQQELTPHGYHIYCPDPYRWYLCAQTSLPEFDAVPTACAMTDKTHQLQSLPTTLEQLLNQIQIALHQHPVNQAREAAGLASVNSLWCWGSTNHTQHKPTIRTPATLYSNNPEIQCYANALQLACQPVTDYASPALLVVDAHCTRENLEEIDLFTHTPAISYQHTEYYQA